MPPEERGVPLARKIFLLVTSIAPPAILVFAVLGSIFFGIAAVTEAAAVGALASILLAASYGRLNYQVLKDACMQTLQITAMILMIAVAASFFATVFVSLNGDEVISNLFLNLPFGKWGILAAIMVLLIIIGMFIDWIGIVFIVVPLITPIA
ncbi:MAG: C4-dicarboxylate ABC transporter, partial [Deltaproteobacteria bacterium CG17_big_fil_post_rev_8_21_14_2_50_51_6]